jgi:hypothetical protein
MLSWLGAALLVAGCATPKYTVAATNPPTATPTPTPTPTPVATPEPTTAAPTTTVARTTPPRPKPTHRVTPTRVATTTVAPRPAPRTTTAAPVANCDPAYPSVCLHDGIGDYDCAGGSGNGPNYVRGPITVRSPDPFGLDRDGDGIGCE